MKARKCKYGQTSARRKHMQNIEIGLETECDDPFSHSNQ